MTAHNDLIIVLPGDDVTQHIQSGDAPPKLGPGIRFSDGRFYSTVAGRLERHRNRSYYVRQSLQRYRPALEDRVVGIVEDRLGADGAGGDVYRVNIGADHPAQLSSLAFEGASKRNKPQLQPGHLIYARIAALFGGQMDPVLSCQLGPHDGGLPRKDWMTEENAYGILKGGQCCRISSGLARELLRSDCLVLGELARNKIAFEIAVGVNGSLWMHSRLPAYTVLIQNAIGNSEVLTDEQTVAMVKSLVYSVEKKLQQDRDAMEE